MGLRIARERAQRIGGRVEVESAPDEGTRVILTLPPQASRAGEGAAATEAGAASASGAAREAKTPLAGSAT